MRIIFIIIILLVPNLVLANNLAEYFTHNSNETMRKCEIYTYDKYLMNQCKTIKKNLGVKNINQYNALRKEYKSAIGNYKRYQNRADNLVNVIDGIEKKFTKLCEEQIAKFPDCKKTYSDKSDKLLESFIKNSQKLESIFLQLPPSNLKSNTSKLISKNDKLLNNHIRFVEDYLKKFEVEKTVAKQKKEEKKLSSEREIILMMNENNLSWHEAELVLKGRTAIDEIQNKRKNSESLLVGMQKFHFGEPVTDRISKCDFRKTEQVEKVVNTEKKEEYTYFNTQVFCNYQKIKNFNKDSNNPLKGIKLDLAGKNTPLISQITSYFYFTEKPYCKENLKKFKSLISEKYNKRIKSGVGITLLLGGPSKLPDNQYILVSSCSATKGFFGGMGAGLLDININFYKYGFHVTYGDNKIIEQQKLIIKMSEETIKLNSSDF